MPRRPKVSDDAILAEVALRGHTPTIRRMAAAVGASIGAVHAAYARLGLTGIRRRPGVNVYVRLPESIYDTVARIALLRKGSVAGVVADIVVTVASEAPLSTGARDYEQRRHGKRSRRITGSHLDQ